MLFYVMRPDNLDEPSPVFTRYGKLTQNRDAAVNRAKRCSGRVYDVSSGKLLHDFYSEPEPKPKLNPREYRAKFVAAQIWAV
jgi:hypothetical protein